MLPFEVLYLHCDSPCASHGQPVGIIQLSDGKFSETCGTDQVSKPSERHSGAKSIEEQEYRIVETYIQSCTFQ